MPCHDIFKLTKLTMHFGIKNLSKWELSKIIINSVNKYGPPQEKPGLGRLRIFEKIEVYSWFHNGALGRDLSGCRIVGSQSAQKQVSRDIG